MFPYKDLGQAYDAMKIFNIYIAVQIIDQQGCYLFCKLNLDEKGVI